MNAVITKTIYYILIAILYNANISLEEKVGDCLNPVNLRTSGCKSWRQEYSLGTLGWRDDDDFESKWAKVPKSRGIPVLTEISQEVFDKEYLGQKPFLFRNPQRSTEFRKEIKKTKFLDKYGKLTVPVGSAERLAGSGVGDQKAGLRKYVEAFRQQRRSKTVRNDKTFFDRAKFLRDAPDLNNLISLPLDPRGDTENIFTIGDSGSGLAFHLHNDAWNEVLTGAKRWALYPPGNATRLGYDPSRPHVEWLRQIYPKVSEKERPLEFIQYQGDLVYVPEGWLHATVNIGETVAYGVQRHQPQEGGCVWHFLQAGPWDPVNGVRHVEAAIRKCGEAAGYYNQLGMLYAMSESPDGAFPDHKKAQTAFETALNLNPRHITTYRNLIVSLNEDTSGVDRAKVKQIIAMARKHGFSERDLYTST